MEKIILIKEKTLEDLLLEEVRLTKNGCSYNFIIEGRDVYLTTGCMPLFMTRNNIVLENWMKEHGKDGKVLISNVVSPKVIAELRLRVGDCPICGGEIVKPIKNIN